MINISDFNTFVATFAKHDFVVTTQEKLSSDPNVVIRFSLASQNVRMKVAGNPQNGDLEFVLGPVSKDEWTNSGDLLNYFHRPPVNLKAALSSDAPLLSPGEALRAIGDKLLPIIHKIGQFFKPQDYEENMKLLNVYLQDRRQEGQRQLEELGI